MSGINWCGMGVVIYSLVVSCLPDRKGITHTPVRYNTGIGMITINHSHSGYAPTKGTASQRLARAIVDHCAEHRLSRLVMFIHGGGTQGWEVAGLVFDRGL